MMHGNSNIKCKYLPFNCLSLHQPNGFQFKKETSKVLHLNCSFLYGAETWTVRKVEQKYLVGSEMCSGRRMENISRTDRVRNEDVEYYVESRKTGIFYVKHNERKVTGLVTSYVGTASKKTLLKER